MRRAPATLAAALVLLLLAAGPACGEVLHAARRRRAGDAWHATARSLVREPITFDYGGPFSGAYRDIPLREGESHRPDLGEPRARSATGRAARSTLGTDGPASQFGAGVVDGKQRIVWRYRAANERRTYTVRYRHLRPGARLRRRGRRGPSGLGEHVEDRPRAPAGDDDALPSAVTPGNARVFGHPVSVRGDTAFEGGVAHLRALDVPAEQFVEMRLLFPRSMLTSTARAKVVAATRASGSWPRSSPTRPLRGRPAQDRRRARPHPAEPAAPARCCGWLPAAAILGAGLAGVLARAPAPRLRPRVRAGAAVRRPAGARRAAAAPVDPAWRRRSSPRRCST